MGDYSNRVHVLDQIAMGNLVEEGPSRCHQRRTGIRISPTAHDLGHNLLLDPDRLDVGELEEAEAGETATVAAPLNTPNGNLA